MTQQTVAAAACWQQEAALACQEQQNSTFVLLCGPKTPSKEGSSAVLPSAQ